MNLPKDTTLALEERRQDSSALPRSMPASFYADPAMHPVEVEPTLLIKGLDDQSIGHRNAWQCVFTDHYRAAMS